MSRLQAARDSVVFLAVMLQGGIMVAAVLIGNALERHPLASSALDLSGVMWGLLATLPPVVAFLLIRRFPVGPLGELRDFAERHIRPTLGPCTLVDLVGISALAGVGEEMMFRGVIQDAFVAAELPVWLAVFLASAAFGLMHAMTREYLVFATLMGAYLGALYVWTGNLVAPMVAHGLYDFVVLWVILRGPGSVPVTEEELEAAD